MKDRSRLPESLPCYIYDERKIRSALRELKEALPGVQFLYSAKCNPFEPVVRTITGEGFGIDAASVGEVLLGERCGAGEGRIYYSAPGKTREELEEAYGRCVITADSLHELALLEEIGKEKGEVIRAGLRVHPDFEMGTGAAGSVRSPGRPSKFGVDLEDMDELKAALAGCPHVKIIGIHVHLKSQVLSAEVLASYYRAVFDTCVRLAGELHFAPEFLNLGSGIGAVYHPGEQPVDLAVLKAALDPIRKECEARWNARLIIETGRYLVMRAGSYLTRVVDRKVSHGKTYIVVKNGMNGFFRAPLRNLLVDAAGTEDLPGMEPLFTESREFEVRALPPLSDEEETVTIVGDLCTPLDRMAQDVTLPKLSIGDVLLFTNAGAYAYSLSPLLFSSQKGPAEYLETEDGEFLEK